MLVPSRRVGFVLATAARLVPCRALGGGAAAHHGAALGSEAHVHVAGGPWAPPPAALKLRQLILVQRHGDRTPITRNVGEAIVHDDAVEALWTGLTPSEAEVAAWAETHVPVEATPGAEIAHLDAGNEPYGQLTALGAAQMRALGAQLRTRLVDEAAFLPPVLSADVAADDIHVRCTSIRRTQQSAANLLMGLYPPGTAARAPEDQPIALRVADHAAETLYPNSKVCPRHDEIIHELRAGWYNGAAWRGRPAEETAGPLAERCRAAFGLGEKVPWSILREVVTCRLVHGVPMPDAVDAELVDDLIEFTGWEWGRWYEDAEMAPIASGMLARELLEFVDAVAAGAASAPKLVLVSGHDSTVVPLLCALGLYDNTWPPYGSQLHIELAEGVGDLAGQVFVRLVFNDKVLPLAVQVDGGGEGRDDSEWAPLDLLRDRLLRVAPASKADYLRRCAAKHADGAAGGGDLAATLGGSKD